MLTCFARLFKSYIHHSYIHHLLPFHLVFFHSGITKNKFCSKKILPKECSRGMYLKLGQSSTTDDFKCRHCPPGKYSDSVSSNTTCKNKVLPKNCEPGEEAHRGDDPTTDDWFCTPKPIIQVACAQYTQIMSRSTVEGLVIGLPERIAPFMKSYKASMRTRGHGRTDLYTRVVVEGERFVSDAERIGFPEGRPLLVLHDPPGWLTT